MIPCERATKHYCEKSGYCQKIETLKRKVEANLGVFSHGISFIQDDDLKRRTWVPTARRKMLSPRKLILKSLQFRKS